MAAAMDEKPTASAEAQAGRREVIAAVAVDACLVAAAMAGASMLAWWAVAFHPSNSRLWMVPVGLVLAFTPAVVYLALSFSSQMPPPRQQLPPPPPPLSLPMVVVHK